MNKSWWQSNTIRFGAITILGALVAYLKGTVDASGAISMAVIGIINIIQRGVSLGKDGSTGGQ